MPLPSSCKGCPLFNAHKNFVPVSGLMHKGVLIVGEAPGEQEAKEGKPFVGVSGKLLDSLLKKAGLSREMFAVHNVLSCRPPNNELRGTSYEREAISHCSPNLDETIRKLRPKVILALGNTPLERLTGVSGITRYRGYPLRGPHNTWVIPTFHPSYLLPRRGQKSTSHLVPAVIRDFKLAIQIAAEGFERPPVEYLEDPPLKRALQFYEEWEKDGCPTLSIDIETPYKLVQKDEEGYDTLDTQILRIGYGWKEGYAMSIPFTPEYRIVHEMFLQKHFHKDKIVEKLGWNIYHFDRDIIQANGIKLGGRVIDGMWAFHYLQPDLPRGLESVGSFFYKQIPWKHLSGERPAYYNCADVDSALQNWLGTKKQLERAGQLEGFEEFVLELDPHLDEAGKNGVFINKKARRILYKKLRKQENAILKEVQPLIPQELKPRKRYKKYPKVHEGFREIESVMVMKEGNVCSVCGSYGVKKGEHTSRKGGKGDIPLNPCYKAPIEKKLIRDSEWDIVLDFNPLSNDQLIAYMKHFGHPVGKHPKTGQPTVDDKHLEKTIERFGRDYPLYKYVTDLRTIRKSLSTYIEGLAPNKAGVVHTQYTYAPASGRLSSRGVQIGKDRGVNLQNIPHRGDHPFASEIRKMITPHPGFCFVEADSSAIEAVMTGYFMGDPSYIELAQRGVHDAFALKTLGLPLTDENIRKFKKASKVSGSPEDLMRTRKKRTVHGVSYGMSARLMNLLYPSIFPSIRSAQDEIDAFYEFVPNLKKWHHETRVQAHGSTYLQLPFGNYRRYFYDVFTYKRLKDGSVVLGDDGKPIIKLGEDGKACIAQQPQGAAGMFMRQNAKNIALEIKERGLPFRIPGNYVVHDSYCLEVPNDPVSRQTAKELLERHLTRPIPEMGGLVVGCEVKWGMDWDDMETF